MAVPDVNNRLLEELQIMGFPLARATRALHNSGNSSLEDAVNWLIDHESDPDIDQMPLVPADIDLVDSMPFQISEEVKKKAERLREQSSHTRGEREEELPREAEKDQIQSGDEPFDRQSIFEKNGSERTLALSEAQVAREMNQQLLKAKQITEETERIRMTALRQAKEETERNRMTALRQVEKAKEETERNRMTALRQVEKAKEKTERERNRQLIEAKQIAEENQRKRLIASREAEKEETERARAIIRQKIEADKAARRSNHCVPPGTSGLAHSDPNVAIAMVQENSKLMSVQLTKKDELLAECLRTIRRTCKGDDYKARKAFQTLQIYVRNIMQHPDVEKYRSIRVTNPAFQDRVGSVEGGTKFLELCGFESRTSKGTNFLYLPRDRVDTSVLASALSSLHTAITNPFFGLISTGSMP